MSRCCREPFSGFSHLIGVVLGVAGLVVLVVLTRADVPKLISMVVYGISLVLLYAASAALHLIDAPARVRVWLSRFDHAAIYALIAGTYTPFCVNLFSGGWRWGLLGTVWALALVGIVAKLVWHRQRTAGGTLLYIAMGWLGVLAFPQIVRSLPVEGIALLVGGGVVYTVGAIFYQLDDPAHRPRRLNFHDVWHLFVLSASALHYAAVLMFVAR